MRSPAIEGFPYFLGIRSLADVARPSDRVCVLNILAASRNR